ncbi:hypothetical protein J8L98_17900 [Pseudoalteromonas sp. MMG013]|uniref:Uncharacterized protein n=1 Tax=Pseudoalteromonas aurantia 208 TaxID=1314867 RepID=A0ABR9EB58_9GAMM|nr:MULTISPECIES: hypothetical protein [Pseudoalteromonas]MBE0368211.1 hypothetical protein [Pseudoalteromonas aurantia 208]MBQ4846061.1 hypothetical protein [Pseudoalteromonas sp. MMG005]MBQ4852085.1 hypothetical protein [Pseudoalteromonas sp. MMG012]MBQ4863559.1 hypothetical protein [Pseudoalteromonas sp. MMG013]
MTENKKPTLKFPSHVETEQDSYIELLGGRANELRNLLSQSKSLTEALKSQNDKNEPK